MVKKNSITKNIKIRSFNFKWYEFFIIYAVLNISYFMIINVSVSNMFQNVSKLHVSGFIMDGSDLSILANLFTAPLILFLLLINIALVVFQEFIAVLVIKLVYFISMVKNEEMMRLYKHVKITLLCLIPVNIICIILHGDIRRIIFFILLYWPIPFFTFVLIGTKIRKIYIRF